MKRIINESFRFKFDDNLIRAYPLRGYTRLQVKQSLRDSGQKNLRWKGYGEGNYGGNLRKIYTFPSYQTIKERWHQSGGFGLRPQPRGYYIASRSSLSGINHSRNTVIDFLLA